MGFGETLLNIPDGGAWKMVRKIALFLSLASTISLLQRCEKVTMGDPAIGAICTWDVPKGEIYTFHSAPGGPQSVGFVARVYEASHDTSCMALAKGPHPLVVMAHGRIAMGVPHNHKGMTYLAHHLASWGDMVVSVNLDVVNSLQGEQVQNGIPHRGELVLHTIEYMLAQNRMPGSRFYQRIDTTRIALVGHSRGGGAVIYAANYNAAHEKRPIKAVATLSPANFGTAPLQAKVPHLCLYGTWDGDLYEGQGPDIWSRGTRSAPRELVEVYGANHYFFTDKITFTPESAEISRQAHHLLAKAMVNAWFDRYLREKDRFDWAQFLTGNIRLGKNLEYYPSFQDAEFVSIDDSSQILRPNASSVGLGGGIVPGGLAQLNPVELSGKPDFGAGIALQAAWDTRKDALEFHFPPLDVSRYAYLSFRMSQVHGDSLNMVDFRKDFHVEVTDASGGEAKVRAGDYLNGLQYPDLSGSLKPDDPNNRKQIMRGFRIPKGDLKGVNFSQVNAVKLVFDRPRTKGFDNISGTVKVADLEFSN
jgi:dienelactone hydrolase